MQATAIIIACIVGAIALGSAIWTWVSKQVFGYGGSILGSIGLVLIGLSIWKTLEITAGADGIKLKFDSLNDLVATAKSIDPKTLNSSESSAPRGITLVCPASPAGLAFCASLGEKLDAELSKIRATISDIELKTIASQPIRISTLNDTFLIIPKSVVEKIRNDIQSGPGPNNDLSAIIRDPANGIEEALKQADNPNSYPLSGVDVGVIRSSGILGGPNSQVNKFKGNIDKLIKF